jgi:hypothetical protein
MLQIFLIVLVVFLVVMLIMAVGVILSNKQIKGSCGGLNNFKDSSGNSICEACTSPKEGCSGTAEGHRRERELAESEAG